MPAGTFFGEDTFSGPKKIQIQATVRITNGSQLIPIGLEFASNSIIPGMPIYGAGIPEGTIVVEAVNGMVLMSNAATESYIANSIKLVADEDTGLGIGSMAIGTSFIVG